MKTSFSIMKKSPAAAVPVLKYHRVIAYQAKKSWNNQKMREVSKSLISAIKKPQKRNNKAIEAKKLQRNAKAYARGINVSFLLSNNRENDKINV